MELTTPLINHFSSRKMEYLSTVLVYARHLRQSDGWKNRNNSDPLGHTFVEETINTLQLHHLLLAKTKQGDENKALRHGYR